MTKQNPIPVRRIVAAVFGVALAATTFVHGASDVRAAGSFWKPDVRVNYVGKSASGLDVTYTFKITNIGAADAYNVGLSPVFSRQLFGGSESAGQKTYGDFSKIATLKADASVTRQVTCHGSLQGTAIWKCTGATMTATVADDLDTSNNSAHGS